MGCINEDYPEKMAIGQWFMRATSTLPDFCTGYKWVVGWDLSFSFFCGFFDVFGLFRRFWPFSAFLLFGVLSPISFSRSVFPQKFYFSDETNGAIERPQPDEHTCTASITNPNTEYTAIEEKPQRNAQENVRKSEIPVKTPQNPEILLTNVPNHP